MNNNKTQKVEKLTVIVSHIPVVRIRILIGTTVVWIRILVGTTVVCIASAASHWIYLC